MTHLTSRSWIVFLLIFAALMALPACSPVEVEDSPANTQETGESTFTADVVYGTGSFIFPETIVGLADLSSYKATLRLTFDGNQDGEIQQWARTYVMLATNEPAARQLTVENTGVTSNSDSLFMAEMDGAAYERRGEKACNATVLDKGNLLTDRMEPARFLTGVVGAEEAGSETVNGVASNHYTFDERALGQLGLTKSSGELWVASEGDYIVKYLLTSKGISDYFGEGIEGTLTWEYELTDVNKPLALELPNDCPGGLVNAPLLLDATNVLNEPGLLIFNTSTRLADASSFYQEQIPTLGWVPLGEPAITDNMVYLDFTQGDQKMTLMITTSNEITTVHIVIVR